jgi:hypothetical protein
VKVSQRKLLNAFKSPGSINALYSRLKKQEAHDDNDNNGRNNMKDQGHFTLNPKTPSRLVSLSPPFLVLL